MLHVLLLYFMDWSLSKGLDEKEGALETQGRNMSQIGLIFYCLQSGKDVTYQRLAK